MAGERNWDAEDRFYLYDRKAWLLRFPEYGGEVPKKPTLREWRNKGRKAVDPKTGRRYGKRIKLECTHNNGFPITSTEAVKDFFARLRGENR